MGFQEQKYNFVDKISETSKSKKEGSAVLSVSEGNIDIYNLDKVKDWFCTEYRDGEKIRSCDAYYQDSYNNLVIEFKNTHHLKLKEYLNEIRVKFIDTHFILAETFWRNKKVSQMSSKVKVIVVYKDGLSYGTGVRNISSVLNTMKPMKGDTARKSKATESYSNESEYESDVNEIREKFVSEFYSSMEFIDKKDFMEDYIEAGYFQNLN